MPLVLLLLVLAIFASELFFRLLARRRRIWRRLSRRHRIAPPVENRHGRTRRKPDWVRKEVLRLKALSNSGARTVASIFNQLHARHGETVGKTFVANLIRDNEEAILRLRRMLKHLKPRRLPKNLIWALDLTFLPGTEQPRPVLGLVDHGTRLCLALTQLRDRSTIGVLRLLLDALERCGKPKALRTDNERIFTSRLFRLVLWLLRIRHQRSAPHCPWQNGRIERLFLTLKQRILAWFLEAGIPENLDEDLTTVRAWYNHLRPHQHLDGWTPAMAWTGKKPSGQGNPRFYSDWNGRLTGFLFPT
mgnify:CR=1 FL=1